MVRQCHCLIFVHLILRVCRYCRAPFNLSSQGVHKTKKSRVSPLVAGNQFVGYPFFCGQASNSSMEEAISIASVCVHLYLVPITHLGHVVFYCRELSQGDRVTECKTVETHPISIDRWICLTCPMHGQCSPFSRAKELAQTAIKRIALRTTTACRTNIIY